MMALVEIGGLPALAGADPLKAPWWWSQIVTTWRHVQNIREAAAVDQDKQMAPRSFWLDSDKLDRWYDQREQERRARDNY